MLNLTHPVLMLAQTQPPAVNPGQEYFNEINKNFSSDGLISTHWLLIAAGAVLLLLSCISIARWWKHRDQHSHPLLVFFGTARLAGLGITDRWVLVRIARQQSLSSPLTLMLSPATFDHHVKAFLASCPGWQRERTQRRAHTIRQTLYSDHPTHGAAGLGA